MHQFVFGNQPATIFNQVFQRFERLGTQLDLLSITSETSSLQIENEAPKTVGSMREVLHCQLLFFPDPYGKTYLEKHGTLRIFPLAGTPAGLSRNSNGPGENR